jgi:dienelactone hydrolase
MQQAVQDVLSAVDWLSQCGYKKIGIIGASLGSCVAFLAAAHEPRIGYFVGTLMSSYFGDVIWTGKSTSHIRESLPDGISQEDLRLSYLPNSPISFVANLPRSNPELRQLILSARYDQTFVPSLTETLFTEYDRRGVNHKRIMLPCGHYSIGSHWFGLVSGWHIVDFFRKPFRSAISFSAPKKYANKGGVS